MVDLGVPYELMDELRPNGMMMMTWPIFMVYDKQLAWATFLDNDSILDWPCNDQICCVNLVIEKFDDESLERSW